MNGSGEPRSRRSERSMKVLVVDPEGGHWVRFVVTCVPVSLEKPHGIDYPLTLHGAAVLRERGVIP